MLATARAIKGDLETAIRSTSGPSSPGAALPINTMLLERARSMLPTLATLIQASGDPHKLEEMLTLNDELTELINQTGANKSASGPSLLALSSPNGHTNGGPGYFDLSKGSMASPTSPMSTHGIKSPVAFNLGGDDDDIPTTPSYKDKGKGRATPDLENGDGDNGEEEVGKIIPEPGSSTVEILPDGEVVPAPGESPTDSRYVVPTLMLHEFSLTRLGSPLEVDTGLKKKARCSGRASSCSQQTRWRVSLKTVLARSFGLSFWRRK